MKFGANKLKFLSPNRLRTLTASFAAAATAAATTTTTFTTTFWSHRPWSFVPSDLKALCSGVNEEWTGMGSREMVKEGLYGGQEKWRKKSGVGQRDPTSMYCPLLCTYNNICQSALKIFFKLSG